MKKIILLALMFLFTNYFLGCSSDNNITISGKYGFDKIIYLSSLSSSTKDYMEKGMEGTAYKISKESFEIVNSESHYKISKPTYKREKMDDDLVQAFNDSVFGTVSISEYKEKYQYSIYNNQNDKTNFYLYSMNDELWIASYVDKTAYYIFKLK